MNSNTAKDAKSWTMEGSEGWGRNGRESSGAKAGENAREPFKAKIYSELARAVFLCPLNRLISAK